MMEGLAFHADKALLDTVFDGVIVINLRTLRISLANKAAAAILGFDDPDELLGVDPLKYVLPEDRQRFAGILTGPVSGNCLQAGTEMRALDRRGREIWIAARGAKMGSNGTSALVASFKDITAQKLLDTTLREAKDRQIRLLNTSNELILICQDWKIVFANRRLQEATGLSGEALIGMSILDLIHLDDRQRVTELYQKTLDGESISSDWAFRALAKGGETAWGIMRHAPVTWQGKPGMMTMVQDVTEQKRAEESLRQSEERFRQITENMLDAISLVDEKGTILYASPSHQRIVGYGPQDLVGKSVFDFVCPEDIDSVMASLEGIMERREATYQYRFRHADGHWVWGEASARLLLDDAGNALGFVIASRDITDRKEAEETLRQSEEKFRLLTERTNDLIFTTDLNLKNTYVSPSVERILGFTPEEFSGRDITQHLTPASLELGREELLKQLALEQEPDADPGRSARFELEFYCKDGSTVWLENEVTGIRDANGNLVGIHGVARGVSERRKVQQALRASEERYRKVVENANEAITVVQDGLLKYVNPRFCEQTGYSAVELASKPFLELVHPGDHQMLAEHYIKRQRGVDVPHVYQFRFIDKAGNTRWAEIDAVLFEWEGRLATLGLIEDITERRRAEQALQESESRFRALSEAAEEGVAIHDEGIIVEANEALARMFGYPLPELIGMSAERLSTPESWRAIVEHMASASTEPYEGQGVRKDGSAFWCSLVSKPYQYKGRTLRLTTFMDITDRRKVQEESQRRERFFRAVIENSTDGILVVGRDGSIKYESPGALRLLGLSEGGIVKNVLDPIHPEDLPIASEALNQVLSGVPVRVELRARYLDGSWRTIEAALVSLLDDPGVEGIVINMRDVTERKRTEEALLRIRKAVESSGDAIGMSDAQGHHFYQNKAFNDVFGWTAEELEAAGGGPAAYADRGVAREVFNTIMGGGSWSGEVEMVSRGGRRFPVRLRADAVKDEAGKVVGLVGFHTDISERKNAEEALRTSEQNYRNLFGHILMGLQVIDAETVKTVLANESMARMLDFESPEEMVGAEPLDYIVPEDLEYVVAELTRFLADPAKRALLTFRCRTSRGRTIWVNAMANHFEYLFRPSVLLSVVDVTAAKEAELKVAESEEKNRLLIENAAEGIAVIQDGVVKFANPKCLEFTGYEQADLDSMPFLDLIHPDDRPLMARNYADRLEDKEVPNNYLFRIIDKTGNTKWLQISAVRLAWEGRPATLSMLNDVTARREAEEALRESNSRYRLLAENVSDVIYSLNVKSRHPFFSPSVTRLLGYTVGEVQSMKTKEVVSPTSYPKVMMALTSMLTGQQPGSDDRSSSSQMELELMRRDGSFVWVDASVTLLRDADGKPAEFFGVMRDITHRKKAEEALRASEEYFRALIENAWDAIAIVDGMGKMLYESPSSARILGYEPEEIVGKNLAEFVRLEDVAEMTSMFRQFRNEPGAIVMVDAGFRHKYGHYIECEGTLQNFLHDPKINGIVANYRDVTDRRRAEEAVRTSEERFRNLVEATSDFVWEVDHNGTYTYVSPRVREVMGYDVGEMIGKSIFDFVPSRELGFFANIFRSHASRREPFAFVENSRLHKDGRLIIMETSGVPFFRDDGSLLGYRGIGRDITNKKKVEKELEDSLKKVEKTMEATIQTISYTMETRDPYTTGHQRRVTRLACAIAKAMEVPQWQIDGIRVAGLLHDIGKIAVPTEILSKPGKLSEIEFSMIRAHPKVGFDILKNVEFDWPIGRIVVQHHERLDGSGYPYGLKGDDILVEARILAVADVVEAMSSHRPYRPALGIEMALAEVARGGGTLYDPKVVEACSVVINEQGFTFEG